MPLVAAPSRPFALALAVTALFAASLATAAPAAKAPHRAAQRATHATGAALAPAEKAAAMRAIAIAEDERRWSDGELAKYLKSGDASVRARAALAVGRLQDSTSVPAMLPLLGDDDAGVRRECAFALGQIGHRGAVAALEAGLTDSDAETADRCYEALGKIGDRSSTALVAGGLSAASPVRRAHAAVALWRLADPTALGVLLAHLGEREADVRWRIVYALEKLTDARRIGPAVEPLLRDPDPLVRAHAARTLGRAKCRASLPALLAALEDTDAAVVVNALRSVQMLADSSDARALVPVAKRLAHRSAYVRVTAATALAERALWQAVDVGQQTNVRTLLTGALGDYDAATRGAVARALLSRFGFDAWDFAEPLLRDSSVYARVAVIDGLRAMTDAELRSHAPKLSEILYARLHPSEPRFVRMTAAEVAGQLGGRLRAPELAPLLPLLRADVDDADVLVAASCAGALADWHDTLSVNLLARAYSGRGKDADADARLAIRDALRELAGRAFADSVERAAPPAASAKHEYAAGWELPPTEHHARLTTSAGVIEWEFLGDEAPQTVRNFVTLAKKGYFDGLLVHRVVPDFVIQDGDPTGTGSGGPGYTIRCEYNAEHYESGMVGMALSGKDTGGSQWFITLAPQPHLNGRYTIFARVTSGLDVARRITQGTRIVRIEVLP